jgi:ADP-ribosyl-[dinitrogen reductase] hydrolase
MTTENPYVGATDKWKSGNGSIMRLAPIMLANHNCMPMALAESVAVSLMTHGNKSIVQYTAAFVTETMAGSYYANFDELRNFNTRELNTKNTIMHCYKMAYESMNRELSFEDTVLYAVNKGFDADTVGAVVGMVAGRIYGYSSIPKRWTHNLVKHDELMVMAEKLYKLGE